MMAAQTYRARIGKAEPFEQHHRRARRHLQRKCHIGVGGNFLQPQHFARWLLVVPSYPFRKPCAARNPVVQHVFGDKAAAALLDADEPVARQFFQCAPHCVAINRKLRSHLRLGRQARARRQGATVNLAFQLTHDLPPAC